MTRRLHPRSRTRFAGAIAFGTRGSRHNDLGETVDALGRAAEQLGLFVVRGAGGEAFKGVPQDGIARTSFHNCIKTWYAPLLFRPQLFLRGVRLLFGDHAMFFRRADFLAVGGCDPTLLVMEEADLCIRFHRLGRTRLVNRVVITSDRRVAAWGALRANWIYLKVGARWGLGFRKGLERHYPDVR